MWCGIAWRARAWLALTQSRAPDIRAMGKDSLRVRRRWCGRASAGWLFKKAQAVICNLCTAAVR